MAYEQPVILTIAGSDSGGGAGIQADIKAITMMGGYAASAVTALTAQNTMEVAAVEAPSPAFVAKQIKAVLTDMDVAAAKTGMLYSSQIVEAVADCLADKSFPLVVDPVCVSQTGAELLLAEAVQALTTRLFPLADLLTPNIPEAELFTGMKIKDRDDVFKALEKILAMGSKAVLIKGGHMDSPAATDWLMRADGRPVPLMQRRVETANLHGTGCTLSAAIAAGLGKGLELVQAVREAQEYLNMALRSSFRIGEGSGPPNHAAPLMKEKAKTALLDELAAIGRRLAAMEGLARLVPEVRMNVALAAPLASDIRDVAAFTGRVTRTREGEVIVAGRPAFGASSHMAKVVLTARRARPEITCAANILHNDAVLAAVTRAGLSAAVFDRADEPEDVKLREGSSLEWGTQAALESHPDPGSVDAVADPGEKGKEPMIRVLARNGNDLLAKLERILQALAAGEKDA